jgi:Fe-Mn family superoxide dismutase
MEYHYGKHHAGYVEKLNELVQGTPYARMPLPEVILKAARDKAASEIFNNAAQVWNHDFFWRSMTPGGGGSPGNTLAGRITADFGSFDEFAKAFVTKASGQFGSGWVWLIADDKRLQIVSTSNAELPMTSRKHALLTCDVWEHAYYLDYQNDRGAFVETFLDKLVNWEFAAERLAERGSTGAGERARMTGR